MPDDEFSANERVNGAQPPRAEDFTLRTSLPAAGKPPAGSLGSSASSSFERWLLRRALATMGSPPIAIELWDGQTVSTQSDRIGHWIHIADRPMLWRILLRPEFEFAEGYVAGRVTTDSDLVELTQVIFDALRNHSSETPLARFTAWAGSRPRSLKAARKNIHRHYDLGNEFYRLWLDENLLYTCAYFESEAMSLEEAQTAKMDYICRKLRLQAGDRVIDAGCGWGSFALHMARHYGAQVTAYNISREQITHARAQAWEQGLSDRVTFIEDDWRHITGECDAFVSVGMLEHVGPENYRRLGRIIAECLAPDGRGLIHSIGLNRRRPFDRWTEKRIFPGAQPPSLREAMAIFEPSHLSILDVENLRLHYAETLRHWLARFERSADRVREMFDDRFVRMWRLYLASSVSTFETGGLQLFQITFTPASNNRLPRTRASLYPPQTATEGLPRGLAPSCSMPTS